MGVPMYVVDAFADGPFAGNPAAVCLLERPADEGWMQSVAAEMNLSETAFLVPESDGYRLRWFTPTVEVALCGHATLASAHILWETARLPAGSPARFQTRSGALTATRAGDEIVLDFPAVPVEPCAPPDGLIDALGAAPRSVARNRMDMLVELDSESAVRGLRPDFGRLAAGAVRGVLVTVTGSAHCALGPFWAKRLGKNDLVGRQVSRRGGTVRVSVRSDRVQLAGRAVTVLRGELGVD
jgi:predicted PhzF superfamily epimerase YddE/YHI9